MNAPDRYAVLGRPVSHSLSPAIHMRFSASLGHAISYERVEPAPDGFAEAVARLREQGFRGCNVTLPFKEEAFRLATSLTDRALACGAANTLAFGAEVLGDNTDGSGFIADVEGRLGVGVGGKSVLVLGAGGAARGILPAVLGRSPARVCVANRTLEKALRLAADFGVEALTYPEASAGRYDLVVNATSLSLTGGVPPVGDGVYRHALLAYDLVYGVRPTAFMEHASSYGAQAVSDGLGMLVEQAAESYLLWRGVRPATDSVYRDLRQGGV